MQNKNGFTLIEMIFTIMIVAVLASIALPIYQNHTLRAKVKEAQSNLIALSLSAESAYQRTLSYPVASLTTTSALTGNGVFSTWMPSSTTFEYQYSSADGTGYTLTANANDSKLTGCTLTLNNVGTKTLTGCTSVASWVN